MRGSDGAVDGADSPGGTPPSFDGDGFVGVDTAPRAERSGRLPGGVDATGEAVVSAGAGGLVIAALMCGDVAPAGCAECGGRVATAVAAGVALD